MALEAISVLNKFGTYAPVVSKVFKFMRDVLDAADNAGKNDKRCKELRARLGSVHETLEVRARHIQNDYPFGRQNTENLMRILEKVDVFLHKFAKHRIRNFL